MVQQTKPNKAPATKNTLNELGYKIFLDRYAQKDMTRATLAVGDRVIVVVNSESGQREVGMVTAIALPTVTIELLDGTMTERTIEHVDKPLETDPSQMLDRVARGLASAEKTPKARKDWEKKFRWLLDDFKFVPAGRILAAAGTDAELTFYNCMPPEQEVLTASGYKPIAEVAVGEMVVTHKNRLRPVLHKFERETVEPMYAFSVKKIGYDMLRVTGEHKVYALRSEAVKQSKGVDRPMRITEEPQWIPAKDLQLGDFLAVGFSAEECPPEPIQMSAFLDSKFVVEDGQLRKLTQRAAHGYVTSWGTHFSLNDTLEVDEDLCYLFGRWLGDGCITHRTNTDIPSGIKIVFALDEHAEAEKLAEIIQSKFGIAPALKLSSTKRWYDLWVNSMPLGEFFKALFGAYSYGKRIPQQLMYLPSDLIISLLRGLFQADGYISGEQLGMLLANRSLTMQVHQLLLRLGYVFSIKENTHKNGRLPAYRLSAFASECAPLFEAFFDTPAPVSGKSQYKVYVEVAGQRWLRIDQIHIQAYSGIVMDMEVAEDHSFVSAGVVVSNCYVIPSPKDSRGGIIETLRQMTEIMSRGGGVGINVSSLRPHHAYVKGVNGRSSGAVSWGALYSFVTGLIEQGGSRRGALMLILDDWHPDVFNFINSKREAGKITNANISVGISDRLMAAVKADGDWELMFPDTTSDGYDEQWDGDLDKWVAAEHPVIHYKTIKARELWNALIESAWASAEPGVFFRERYNKMSNSGYFSPIIATNPCVTGDTRISTANGLITARDLFDSEQPIEVVIDGRFGVSHTTTQASRVIRTGEKLVYRLQTSEGYFLRATADHRVMTPSGWVELGQLQPGDKIHIANRKGSFGSQGSLEIGRVLGLAAGNDRLISRSQTITARQMGIAAQSLVPVMEAVAVTEDTSRVPEAVFQGTEDMQRGFLQALFNADGAVLESNVNSGFADLTSAHIAFLEGVQGLLLNFGIVSRIDRGLHEAQHELVLSKRNMAVFAREIGFILDRKQARLEAYIDSKQTRGLYSEKFIARVESISADGIEEVFDLNEPLTHSFVANSIVVHNCGEQGLPGFGVCNLGAINLSKFYDADAHDVLWDDLDTAVRYATRFLDNVVEVTPYFFDENERQQKSERRVGLNNMGLAELLIKLGIRYGSDDSLTFIDKLYSFIARASYETSIGLAKERGAFPQFQAEPFLASGFMQTMPADIREQVRKHGIRNVTLLTQAPTGTTGTMVNTSTGIEPFFSWKHYRKSRLGFHEENAQIAQDWFNDNPGADTLPDHFVTAMELTPEEHVRVQAAIQRWVDSSISKTANVPNHYTVEQTRELYEYMYDLGCKGGTIYRDGSRSEQVLNLTDDRKDDVKAAPRDETPTATPHRVYPRPGKLHGVTVHTNTPYGTAYITMNSDEHGYPFELFIVAPGKAGSDLQADAEGLGRMISLQLRTTAPENRMQMLKLVIDQLQGIGGSRSVGFGVNRIMSLPDAVGQSLMDHYFPEDKAQQLSLFQATFESSAPAPAAPVPAAAVNVALAPTVPTNGHSATVPANGKRQSKAEVLAQAVSGNIQGAELCPSCQNVSLVRAEGCKTCLRCGFSEC